MRKLSRFTWLAGTLLAAGCGRVVENESPGSSAELEPRAAAKTDSKEWLGPVTIDETPAAPGARFPHLAGGRDGTPVVMSWVEPGAAGVFVLRQARRRGDGWSAPVTVAEGSDWFINWADFPSVVPVTSTLWVAHWLQQRPGNIYSYDVRMRTSADGGATWSGSFSPHDDGTPTEHGFVSIVNAGGQPYVVWLDGRKTAGEAHGHEEHAGAAGAMTLRGAHVKAAGTITDDIEIDARVCDCCPTDAVSLGAATLVVYRDRSTDETRDIRLARVEAGHRSAPVVVHEDGWRIDACPVNGPAIDASGDVVAVAWFTAPDQPRVRLAFSTDAGKSFAAPFEVATGRVLGRVDLVVLPDGRAITSWLEQVPGGALIRAQPFTVRGAAGPAQTIAPSAIARSSGYPQMLLNGGHLMFAWTETGEPAGIRTAVAALH